jgi:tetratricopeptide (TPR) repeat protein
MNMTKKVSCFLAFGFTLLAGCASTPKGVAVEVVQPPEISLPEGVTKIFIGEIKGNERCAEPIKSKLESMVAKGEIFGFEEEAEFVEEDVTVTINGNVKECKISDGSGEVYVELTMYFGGEVLRKRTVSKSANRPGSTSSEIRDVLSARVAKEYLKLFMHTTRRELREFKGEGANQLGVKAAVAKNWNEAIRIWSEQIKKYPNNHESLYNRGIAREAKGGAKNIKKALKDYRGAIALKRDKLYLQAEARAEAALKSLEGKMKAKDNAGM